MYTYMYIHDKPKGMRSKTFSQSPVAPGCMSQRLKAWALETNQKASSETLLV